MIFYADYEALEFNNQRALEMGIYPTYLDATKTETSLCPIFLSACTREGEIFETQNVFDGPISFLKLVNKYIKDHTRAHFKTMFVWFHNTSYDVRILLHELFYNGFVNIVDSDTITYYGEYLTEKSKAFSIVGESLSKFIGINIYYRGFKIVVRDTMSILNSSQDQILLDFGFPTKVEVDWEKITIDNLKENIELIKERNIYDVTSLAKAIETFKETFYQRFKGKGSTAASMSMDALRHHFCKLEGEIDINIDEKKSVFRRKYPRVIDEAKDIADGCYSGGICTINHNHAGKIIRNVQMIDVNSSYPASMTKPLPAGPGMGISKFCKSGYSEYVVYVQFKHKGIPFQRCHTETRARAILGLEQTDIVYTKSQYPPEFEGYLCINSIDLATLLKHAEVTKLEFCKGVNYETNTELKEFIEPIYEERKHSKGVTKLAIKLLLNSLYGKFAQDLSGIIYQYSDIETYHKITAIDNETLYKPLSSAVTAYSRKNWIDTVYLIGDDFIYGDTDSVYFKNVDRCSRIFNEKGIIHSDDLGKWAFDKDYGEIIKRGKFLSKKNYLLEFGKGFNKDKYPLGLKVTCVGLSHKYHDQVTFDNFVIGSSPFAVRKMVNIYGGKAMRETEFRIKERHF